MFVFYGLMSHPLETVGVVAIVWWTARLVLWSNRQFRRLRNR